MLRATLEDIDALGCQEFVSLKSLAALRASSRALAKGAYEQMVARLCVLSRNPSAKLRKVALRALGWLCAPDQWHLPFCTLRAQEATRRCLQHRCHGIRRAAVGTLRWLAPQDFPSLRALVACLQDPQWQVRVASARALGEMSKRGDSFVSSALTRSLADEASAVRLASVISLGQLAVPDDTEVLAALVNRLADFSDEVRKAALEVLQQLKLSKDKGLVSVVAKHLGSPVSKVRKDALWALGKIAADNNPSAVSELVVHLADHSRTVRRAAVVVLGRLAARGNLVAFAAIHGRLHDPSACVRRAARAAMALGGKEILCSASQRKGSSSGTLGVA
ncbi:unnamed protein product [Effrenium voratum]|nr:unnamed protein product [Effrenium voratum]